MPYRRIRVPKQRRTLTLFTTVTNILALACNVSERKGKSDAKWSLLADRFDLAFLTVEVVTPGKDASKASADELNLVAIDVYSGHDDNRWTCFTNLPLQVQATQSDGSSLTATITRDSTGKDLVSILGEPQRKGGGAGGRSGPAAWMEWSFQIAMPSSSQGRNVKLQIELAGASARGVDRWNPERAGACKWEVITIS